MLENNNNNKKKIHIKTNKIYKYYEKKKIKNKH